MSNQASVNDYRLLPSVVSLAELRRIILSPCVEANHCGESSDNALLAIIPRLKVLREQVLTIVNEKKLLGRAGPMFEETCSLLSTLPPNHVYSLPPLFHTDSLARVFNNFIINIMMRESKSVCFDNTGHVGLDGGYGVGKTTILRAMSLTIAILLHRVVPVTHDYNSEFLPLNVIFREAYQCYVERYIDELVPEVEGKTIIGKFSYHNHTVCLLLDEVQHLFILSSTVESEIESEEEREIRLCVRDIFSYCRGTSGTYCIMAASPSILPGYSDLRSLLYRRYDRDRLHDRGYIRFKSSLFNIHSLVSTVPRSIEQLQQYVRIRYSTWDTRTGDDLLTYSGGIGKWVDRIYSHSIASQVDSNSNDILTAIVTERCNLLQTYLLQHNDHRKIILTMTQSKGGTPSINERGCTLNCGSMSGMYVDYVLKEWGIDSPWLLIYTAVAKEVLFVTTEMNVQFVLPIDYVIIKNNLLSSEVQQLLTETSETMPKILKGDDMVPTKEKNRTEVRKDMNNCCVVS